MHCVVNVSYLSWTISHGRKQCPHFYLHCPGVMQHWQNRAAAGSAVPIHGLHRKKKNNVALTIDTLPQTHAHSLNPNPFPLSPTTPNSPSPSSAIVCWCCSRGAISALPLFTSSQHLTAVTSSFSGFSPSNALTCFYVNVAATRRSFFFTLVFWCIQCAETEREGEAWLRCRGVGGDDQSPWIFIFFFVVMQTIRDF